ncbi:MAG: VWA domain-containing protein [Thiotrichaceae bacterium]|nr:VWA domain-containing protein [Thiotrichaceae bacterium]
MLLFFLLVLWAGIGSVLLYLKSKPAGTVGYLRKVDQRIYNSTETINVTLTLTPPLITTVPIDNHDILLVLDHSISMGSAPGSPLRESVRAMENFVQQLPKSYHIGLIIFDHEAQCLCHITAKKEKVLSALKTISPGGCTELHLALDKSKEILEESRQGVKKTIILLSDGGSNRKAAEHSAAQLQEDTTIICVGLGANVDEELMKSVATKQHYIHVETADHLEPLFELLIGVVSEQVATAVLVKEKISAPHHFHLENTGNIYPVGIHQRHNHTEVGWFVSVLETKAVSLNYQLHPKCFGWHSIADGQAYWKMPNGEQKIIECAAGPKILVLPNGLTWTGWWLLNPLFWLIFGRLFKCSQPNMPQKQTEIEDLPIQNMPKPLSVPEFELYSPKVRPALIIGLGALGEWSLNRLKWQLQDRKINQDVVDLLVIQDSGVYNRPSVTVNGCLLDDSERIILKSDLRPYLEKLRLQKKTPDSRAWIPWRQWLRESRPLITYTDDRRKARLALLLQPEEIEKRIKQNVARILSEEGMIMLVDSDKLVDKEQLEVSVE